MVALLTTQRGDSRILELKRMNPIEIDINNTHQDIRRWAIWRLFHSTFYICYLILDILLASLVLLFTDFGKNDFESVIFVAFIVSILPIAACLGLADRTWKQVKGQQRIIRFENEGVRIVHEHIEGFYKWSAFRKVTETQNYLFAESIYRTPMFVLSKNWLNKDDLDKICKWMALKEIDIIKKGS